MRIAYEVFVLQNVAFLYRFKPMMDNVMRQLIAEEEKRQNNTIDLIASENYVSRNVREALGSAFTNKYAEGYPYARWYAGVEVADVLEREAQSRALKLFRLSPKKWSVNVQPLSGSPANLAVYLALVPKDERMMGMRLDAGGHLTHGFKGSISGKFWDWRHYAVNRSTELLDYEGIMREAKAWKPKLIIAGGSAYSRVIDWKAFRRIADSVGALLMVDLSHYAGLVAGGSYSSPFPVRGGQALADIVMTTTHKTLRGPRGAMIFSRLELSKAIDRAVFPGVQGGPHLNQIAALGVALKEAGSSAFRAYAKQTVKNARALAKELQKYGWRIVSGGTDSHLFTVDTGVRSVRGGDAEKLLERVGIITNREEIPFDTGGAKDPSGVRLGTPAVTTRGMKEKEMKIIAGLIHKTLTEPYSRSIKESVQKLCRKFPLKT